MSNAINDGMAHRKGNSLSPESCVLSPAPIWAEGPMHRLGSSATQAASNADATSTPTASMHALREIGGGR